MLIVALISFQTILPAQQQSADIYQPTAEDQRLGQMILQETRNAIEKAGGAANYIDYWNFATAYRYLGIEKDSIYINLQRSAAADPQNFLELVNYGVAAKGNDINLFPFYKCLGTPFLELVENTKKIAKNQIKSTPEHPDIINQKVVNLLIEMMESDQQYRKSPDFFSNKSYRQKQYVLDSLNAQKLYALYQKYGYPGKSITGDNEYQDYFCLMVEHGQNQTDKHRFWLPIIAEAFKKNELHAACFKMLLDRIHWLETGKQYFGSHLGIPLERNEEITKIRALYGL